MSGDESARRRVTGGRNENDAAGGLSRPTVPPTADIPPRSGPSLEWLMANPLRLSTYCAGYQRGVEDGETSGYDRGYIEGWRDGAERGYQDGAWQGRHDVRSGYARTQAARDAIAALAAFDEAWLRRLSPEALARAALVRPGVEVDTSDAARDRERLAVVLRALHIAEHREIAQSLRAAS